MSAPPRTDDAIVQQSEQDTRSARTEVRVDPHAMTPRQKVLHYGGVPTLVIVILVLLLLYLNGQAFDSIEARNITLDNVLSQTRRHIWLTVLSTIIVVSLAVPLGIIATRPRTRRLAPAIIGLGNAGQAIPSLGLLAIVFVAFSAVPALPSTGVIPVTFALVAVSFLPILRNTMVGLDGVDRDVLEAGSGMGMSQHQVLRLIELPLAIPVMLAGVRTALILNVGTATLAFLFGGGGLGFIIFTGFNLKRTPILVTGAVLAAVLALLVDYIGGLIEEWLTPKGL
ncbi:MAG TPA: ABC transporter permease [Euzebyales bacterium]|nr:ABC transporter permease [Euzebyales bacterium]